MLVEIKTLSIENNGYRRNITLKKIYVNSSNIVSISDYQGAENFLLQENSDFSKESFSLININQGNKSEEIIAFGSAEQIYNSIGENLKGKQLLNG